jgi:hypothetical protein
MSTGGGNSGSSTNTAEPWGPAQPHLENIMAQAASLYQQNAGGQAFPGSTVVPFSPQTEAGLSGMENQALGGAPLYDQALQGFQRTLSGFNPGLDPALAAANSGPNPFTGAVGAAANQQVAPGVAPFVNAGAAANPYTGALASSGAAPNPFLSTIGQAGSTATTAGMDTLANTASGANLLSNPWVMQQFNQGAQGITNQVNADFNKAGMYGGGHHEAALAGQLGNLYTSLAAPAYQQERALMEQSAANLGNFQANDLSRALQSAGMGADAWLSGAGLNQAGLQAAGGLAESQAGRALDAGNLWGNFANQDANRALTGATTQADLANQDAANRLSGASLAGNLWQQGNQDIFDTAQQLPGVYDYGSMPAQQLLGVGAARESQAGLELQDAIDRFNFAQQEPYQALDRYRAAIGELPLQGLGTSTTVNQSHTNPFLGALGGAAGGAGLVSAMSMSNPWLAALMIGGGALAGSQQG